MRSGRNRLPDPAHANNAQSFPGDMLTQILYRMPARPLPRPDAGLTLAGAPPNSFQIHYRSIMEEIR